MNKTVRRKCASLFVPAAMLLMLGSTAILAPILVTDLELRSDTEAYEQLSAKYRISDSNESPGSASLPDAFLSDAPEQVPLPEIVLGAPIPIRAERTSVDLAACKAENDDFVAWLQIPNTTVDYPVVSTNDTDYYLNHAFSGKKSYLGTLFSLGKTDYKTPCKNIAIYGHHIRSNSQVMFSPLLSYKKQSFYVGHETIYLDSLFHSDTYTIFAVINICSGDWDPSTTSFASDDDFMAYVLRARSQSLYETGVEVTAKDQILTLTTCDRSYFPTYGRLVVMAVRQEPFN